MKNNKLLRAYIHTVFLLRSAPEDEVSDTSGDAMKKHRLPQSKKNLYVVMVYILRLFPIRNIYLLAEELFAEQLHHIGAGGQCR